MKLFLPQATLEEWALSEQADVQDGHLVVAATQERYPVTPAVHFRSLVSGADEAKLVRKVKTGAQLEALGAEHMADSVLLGENAYEVTEGYLAEVALTEAQPAAPAPPQNPKGETDLLAEFLLNKL